jgi:hypothetical protein
VFVWFVREEYIFLKEEVGMFSFVDPCISYILEVCSMLN